METRYVSKLFYLKKDDFCIQKLNKKKKVRKEANEKGKRLKAIRKKIILIKIKKKRVFHVKLV